MRASCLVTGGAGFIGSNLVERLLADGASVRVLDNFSTGRRCNLDFARDRADYAGRLEVLEGDVRDFETCRAAVRGVELVFHQAALPSVQRSVEDPVASHNVNATGSLHVLTAAREAGVRRVVFASSSSVYGDNPELPKLESHETRPMSPYAISKLAGEQYARVFHRLYGFEAVALRYFNVFGPRQDPDSHYSAVIPRFIRTIMRGEAPDIYGDGEQSRDFTFVANVVEANLLAATAPDAPGRAFNIALGGRVSLNALLEMIGRILGTPVTAHYLEPRKGDIKHSQASVEEARRVLGYRGEVPLEEGLRQTVDHFPEPFAGGFLIAVPAAVGMILTNSRMHQSPVWLERTRTVAGPTGPAEVVMGAARLFAARRSADGVVVLGARAALCYGALTRLFGVGPPWLAKELLLDPAGGGPAARLKRTLYRWALRDCRALVVYSESERGPCAEACGGPPDRCVFVPFHTRRDPAPAAIPGSGPFLAAGRSLRDYRTLGEALRLAGCGADVVATAGEARHFSGVPGARFLGEVPDARYRALLEEATAVIAPLAATARSAGQAVVLEAMALGKATLSADVPGLRDYVEAEVTGLTYRPGDAADMARQLRRLADPRLRARLGGAALARARESFTPDAHARAVLALLGPAGSPA